MQIDFHHGVTYVVARYAGFSHGEANTIAYSAQYVDDATNAGLVKFDKNIIYRRLSSAHGMIDHRNLKEINNHLVWMPFHFLPGNGGLPAGENPKGSFIEKIVCKPNSPVAQDMVEACINDQCKPYALHRLGITAHVYVDTWAHQQFAGIVHAVNGVDNLVGPAPDETVPWWSQKWWTLKFWTRTWNAFVALFQSAIPPIGHGQALTNPDLPFAQWSYTNGLGKKIERDNLTDFTEAADELCKVFKNYRNGKHDPSSTGLAPGQKRLLHDMFDTIRSTDAEERHREWLDAIKGDAFGFGAQKVEFVPKGHGSWKHAALGTTAAFDLGTEEHPYNESFLTSDWKMFHDAAKEHRLTVIDDILPKYGICAG